MTPLVKFYSQAEILDPSGEVIVARRATISERKAFRTRHEGTVSNSWRHAHRHCCMRFAIIILKNVGGNGPVFGFTGIFETFFFPEFPEISVKFGKWFGDATVFEISKHFIPVNFRSFRFCTKNCGILGRMDDTNDCLMLVRLRL